MPNLLLSPHSVPPYQIHPPIWSTPLLNPIAVLSPLPLPNVQPYPVYHGPLGSLARATHGHVEVGFARGGWETAEEYYVEQVSGSRRWQGAMGPGEGGKGLRYCEVVLQIHLR